MGAPKKCRRIGVHNCNWCVTGTYKRPERKRQRRKAHVEIRSGALVQQ